MFLYKCGLVAMLVFASLGGFAQTPIAPAHGNGSASNPYQITVAGNLVWLSQQAADRLTSGACYRLMNDIDMSETAGWNDAGTGTDVLEGFKPIGTHNYQTSLIAFNGVFDGANHTLKGLTIHRPSEKEAGLFGFIGDPGHVKCLNIVGATVTAAGGGALAGYLRGAVSDCFTSGTVTGQDSPVGGMIGENNSGTVTSCSAAGLVRGSSVTDMTVAVGGLIGTNLATVRQCHAAARVQGSSHCKTGGLIGSSTGHVDSCYATGYVTGESFVGGLIGYQDRGTVTSCYTAGPVTGSSVQIGGLIGQNQGLITSCYSNSVTTGYSRVGGLIGLNGLHGKVVLCFATGPVTGFYNDVGGLIGHSGLGNEGVAFCHADGPVTGGDYVGGLIGKHEMGEISCCYATNSTTGHAYVGGLVGLTGYAYGGTTHPIRITDCYSTGKVVALLNRGGLIGSDDARTTCTACYWDTQASGQSYSVLGTGKSTADMKKQATFAGWDFATIWGINGSYPYLHCFDPVTLTYIACHSPNSVNHLITR